MHNPLATVLVAAAILPLDALAYGPPPAAVHIDNDAGTEISVYVDGAWRGTVRRGDDRTFSTLPGSRHVVAKDPSGLVVYDARHPLASGRPFTVRLLPPKATLSVVNTGDAPLWIDLQGCAQPFWLLPGAMASHEVPAGQVGLTTAVYGPQGLVPVGQQTVSLAPGRSVRTSVGYRAPPPHSRISLTNQENHTLRVYVAGREVAAVPAHSTRVIDVAPGRHHVTVVQHQGHMIYNAPITFAAATQHEVIVQQGRASVPSWRHQMLASR